MAKRARVPQEVQAMVLIQCRRRCALCFGLYGRAGVKDGQIAHADRDSCNNEPKNLVWLCLLHRNAYDRRARQSKGQTEQELLAHHKALLEYLAAFGNCSATSCASVISAMTS